MDKRVYGVMGIVSRMSNWNADFTGYPKTTSSGDVFGSDKAFKYPIKRRWADINKKVLYIRSYKLEEKNSNTSMIPKTLKERFEELFEIEDLKKEKDSRKIISNLFNAVDVKNFGATFAEAGNNIGITGAVQIGQGYNKYYDTSSEEQQILSPFRDGSADKDAKSTTLGTKIVSDEAHYFYPFSINPSVYDEYKKLGLTDGYTENDYLNFKESALVSATYFNTNSKLGCENEFALFVETDTDLYLPDLSQYIEFIKEDEKNIINIKCGSLLNNFEDRILNIEIYYNDYTTIINTDIKNYKEFNIFTKKEV